MKKLALSFAAVVASAQASLACVGVACPPPAAEVPEISAMEGTAALAVLAAVVLLAWERRRRAA